MILVVVYRADALFLCFRGGAVCLSCSLLANWPRVLPLS